MNNHDNAIAHCCAECGQEGGVSLKVCKPCMQVRYCNAECQHKHWANHKAACKLRAAKIRDEALFKEDPPPKEDCPICFLPMPTYIISCASLPPATILSVPINDFAEANEALALEPMASLPPATVSSVPIYDFAIANEALKGKATEEYYPCCGKSFCKGCVYSFLESGNDKCPFCNSEQREGKTLEERVQKMMRRVAANDAASICVLADSYYNGSAGFQQDHMKAMELFTKSAELGCSKAHGRLGDIYYEGGYLKKAKFHLEAAAMAGNEVARYNLGNMEYNFGNMERAAKHWIIAASAGEYDAMHEMRTFFEKGLVSRESIDSTLAAYNNSCKEMRSEARDAYIQFETDTI